MAELNIYDLATKVAETRSTLATAMVNATDANKAETEARNSYNEATRAFDVKVAEMRKEVPRGTDWAITARRPSGEAHHG